MKDATSSRLPLTRDGAKAQPSATGRAAEVSRMSRALRRTRRTRGWSQKSLAHWLGISESYLGQIELGKRLPSAGLCQRMRAWIENPDSKQRCAAGKSFILDGQHISEEEVNSVVRTLLETLP